MKEKEKEERVKLFKQGNKILTEGTKDHLRNSTQNNSKPSIDASYVKANESGELDKNSNKKAIKMNNSNIKKSLKEKEDTLIETFKKTMKQFGKSRKSSMEVITLLFLHSCNRKL